MFKNDIKFSKRSAHYKFYKSFYRDETPDYFCNYLWKIALAIASLPLTHFGYGLSAYFNKNFNLANKIWLTCAFYFVNFIIFGGGHYINQLFFGATFYLNYPIGLAFIFSFALFFLLTYLSGALILKALASITKFKTYCPKIIWREKTN